MDWDAEAARIVAALGASCRAGVEPRETEPVFGPRARVFLAWQLRSLAGRIAVDAAPKARITEVPVDFAALEGAAVRIDWDALALVQSASE